MHRDQLTSSLTHQIYLYSVIIKKKAISW